MYILEYLYFWARQARRQGDARGAHAPPPPPAPGAKKFRLMGSQKI